MFRKTFLVVSLFVSSSVFANEFDYLPVSQQMKLAEHTVSVSAVAHDSDYSELGFSQELFDFYTEIENLKKANPHLSAEELVEVIDKKMLLSSSRNALLGQNENFASPMYIEVVKDTWTSLNIYEKYLVVNNPANAYITSLTKDKAWDYTKQHFGKNGLGDKSDAFRHAIWNALMSKYVSEAWAYLFATAHENKSADELKQVAQDGNLESAHQVMDLHNNKEGRACWKWNDTIALTSDNELILRVKARMKQGKQLAGELYWLNK
jgi:hypothetical protein